MLVYWFLPMIFFLGIVTSYEDIKYGKIRNKWILLAIFYTIVMNAMLFLLGYNNFDYSIRFLTNGILSLLIGFMIWYANLWTAGDAKLFFAYSLLISPAATLKSINFAFIDILINTFVPASAFLLFFALVKTTTKEKISYAKEALDPNKLLKSALFIFALMWPAGILASFLPVKGILVIIAIISVFLLYKLEKFLSAGVLMAVIISLSLSRILFDKSVFFADSWVHFFFVFIIFIILRLFSRISSTNFTGKISPKKIKSLSKSAKSKNIKIRENISFAPFLFFGTLLRIILNDNIMHYAGLLMNF